MTDDMMVVLGKVALFAIVVLSPAFAILATYLSAKVKTFVTALAAKYNIEVKEKYFTMIDKLVNDGISATEAWAKIEVKKNAERKIQSSEKLEHAVAYIMRELKDNNVAELAKEQVIEYVEKELQKKKEEKPAILANA